MHVAAEAPRQLRRLIYMRFVVAEVPEQKCSAVIGPLARVQQPTVSQWCVGASLPFLATKIGNNQKLKGDVAHDCENVNNCNSTNSLW